MSKQSETQIKLIVDNRERMIINKLLEKSIKFDVEQLDLGDYQFRRVDNDEILLIIERKTVSDLRASISDGRAREQKARLLNSGTPLDRIMILVEGIVKESDKDSVKLNAVLGSMINSIFRDKIKVYKTSSENETVEFLNRLLEKFKVDYELFFSNSEQQSITKQEYSSFIKKKKKDNMTPELWMMCTLAQIPRLSDAIAAVIQSEYPTMKSLFAAYEGCETEKERYELVANMMYNNRKLGLVLSKRVYMYCYGISE